MLRRNAQCATAFLLGFFLWTNFAVAQTNPAPIDDRVLQQLYSAQLKNPADSYVAKRIADERSRIRTTIDEELNQLVNSIVSAQEEEGAQEASAQSAVGKQQAVVALLETRLNEAKVDRDLLAEEEQKYYLGELLDSGEPEEFRLAKTHPELLAKKAILEERIAALEFFLAPQTDRLERLQFQARLEQFSFLILVGKYVGLVLLIVILERLIRTRILVRIKNRNRRYGVIKLFTTGVYGTIVAVLLSQLFSVYPNIVTSIAIVGAGLAVALQDVVKDVIGWFLLLQGRRYTLGQRVAIGPHTGDVIDITLFRTTLLEVGTAAGGGDLERTGKTLFVPNASVLTQPVLNYNTTSDFIKAELPVLLTYESDWKGAEKILLQILEEETATFTERARRQAASRTQQFYFSHEMKAPLIFMDLGASGVLFTLRFYVPIGERRDVITRISKKILEQFEAMKGRIELAYPTNRVYATQLDATPFAEAR